MPRQTTTYDILFSCPGDVVSHINMVRKAIDSFNETTGMEHQVTFMLRHWSISSCTESGKSGQASINDQFIKNAMQLLLYLEINLERRRRNGDLEQRKKLKYF